MAMRSRGDVRLDALIAQAAEEIKRLNPHIGTSQEPVSDTLAAELEHDARELEQLWDELDRQRGGPLQDEPAAEAVDADRGE